MSNVESAKPPTASEIIDEITTAEDSVEGVSAGDPPAESIEDLIAAGVVPAAVVEALEDARAQANAAEDRVLRMLAETENTRKRLTKDREESVRFANERFIREMLPVVDNLERCLGHSEAEVDPSKLKEGVGLTLKHLLQTLLGFGVEKVDAGVGKPFDAATQEAVMKDSSSPIGQHHHGHRGAGIHLPRAVAARGEGGGGDGNRRGEEGART